MYFVLVSGTNFIDFNYEFCGFQAQWYLIILFSFILFALIYLLFRFKANMLQTLLVIKVKTFITVFYSLNQHHSAFF